MSPMKGNHLSFSNLFFHPRFLSSHTCEVTDATSIYSKINISVFLSNFYTVLSNFYNIKIMFHNEN